MKGISAKFAELPANLDSVLPIMMEMINWLHSLYMVEKY